MMPSITSIPSLMPSKTSMPSMMPPGVDFVRDKYAVYDKGQDRFCSGLVCCLGCCLCCRSGQMLSRTKAGLDYNTVFDVVLDCLQFKSYFIRILKS